MIKIIKEGNPKEHKQEVAIYTVTCPSCDCIFECDSRDFAWRSRTLNFKAGIHCPCCNTEIMVTENTPYKVEHITG